jgi:hypothetical protein
VDVGVGVGEHVLLADEHRAPDLAVGGKLVRARHEPAPQLDAAVPTNGTFGQ